MFNPFRQEAYTPNKPERKTVETFEDAYTIAERKRKLKADLNDEENTEPVYTDKAGRKIPVSQLNGESERLLRRDVAKMQEEWSENLALKKEEDISEDFPPGGKLNKKLNPDFVPTWHDEPDQTNSENLKTYSPARHRHDIRETRKELDKIDKQNN